MTLACKSGIVFFGLDVCFEAPESPDEGNGLLFINHIITKLPHEGHSYDTVQRRSNPKEY